jgi:hypothetical protein
MSGGLKKKLKNSQILNKMEDKILKRELSKRIFANLGAIPNKFGLVGLAVNEYLTDKPISFKNEDGEIEEYPVWAGQLDNHKLLLANIGSMSEPELILIYNDSHALKFIWDESDCGLLLRRLNNKWLPMSVLEWLSLTAASEMIAQQGVLFAPLRDFQEQYALLVSLVEDEF